MLHIHTIPAFNDNYFWVIQPNNNSKDAFVIDPGTAEPVIDYFRLHNLNLCGILITHHHHDHIDGAATLRARFDVPIYGPKSPRIPQVTQQVYAGALLQLNSLEIEVVDLAGHTLDHIGYLVRPNEAPAMLFCGDTLFAVGCGRLFDGTAELLFRALQRIAALPDDTLIYGGHEYTLANINFALTIEPLNQDLHSRQSEERAKRARGEATLPTTLSIERRTNPFLRCHLDSVKTSVEKLTNKQMLDDLDVFTNLRLLKDKF